MAEYLTPGVYIEERDFRSSTIEGVSTTTSGFVGPCGWGPAAGTPVLVTSFEEFQRQFGGLEPLNFAGTLTTNYLAFAVRAFFDNGGKRCYIARLQNGAATAESAAPLFATLGGSNVMFRARFPGLAGNVSLTLRVMRSANVVSGGALRGVRPGDMLEAPAAAATAGPARAASPDASAGHRGWKRHPDGIRVGSGISPVSTTGSDRTASITDPDTTNRARPSTSATMTRAARVTRPCTTPSSRTQARDFFAFLRDVNKTSATPVKGAGRHDRSVV